MISNNTNNLRKTSGFTIVELLIVIVVIGILAAITIVAYNGVQARANNTKIDALAKEIADKAEVAAADNDGKYPTILTGTPATGDVEFKDTSALSATAKTAATAMTTSDPASVTAGKVYVKLCAGAGVRVVPYDYVSKSFAGDTNSKLSVRTAGTCA